MTTSELARLNATLRDKSPLEVVRWAVAHAHGRAIVSTNFRPYEAVILHLAVQVQPDLTHLAFEVDSLAGFEKHLAKIGLKYSDGPTTSSTGTTFAFVDAPEGYEIELIQKK